MKTTGGVSSSVFNADVYKRYTEYFFLIAQNDMRGNFYHTRRELCAEAQRRIVGDISAIFAATLASYQINTRLRIAHFMGQVTHECAGFRTTEEFASGAAYEGRADLGNDQRGDGKRFKSSTAYLCTYGK